jgi:hypothetical protein
MERTELMVVEGVNRLRAGRITHHRPDVDSRRVTDYRMLGKGNAIMRFAQFPTINSDLCNAADLRLQSNQVVGVPMGNRPQMTRRDGASELLNLHEFCDHSQGGTTRTPTARGPAFAKLKYGSPTEIQRKCVTCV